MYMSFSPRGDLVPCTFGLESQRRQLSRDVLLARIYIHTHTEVGLPRVSTGSLIREYVYLELIKSFSFYFYREGILTKDTLFFIWETRELFRYKIFCCLSIYI